MLSEKFPQTDRRQTESQTDRKTNLVIEAPPRSLKTKRYKKSQSDLMLVKFNGEYNIEPNTEKDNRKHI